MYSSCVSLLVWFLKTLTCRPAVGDRDREKWCERKYEATIHIGWRVKRLWWVCRGHLLLLSWGQSRYLLCRARNMAETWIVWIWRMGWIKGHYPCYICHMLHMISFDQRYYLTSSSRHQTIVTLESMTTQCELPVPVLHIFRKTGCPSKQGYTLRKCIWRNKEAPHYGVTCVTNCKNISDHFLFWYIWVYDI